MQLPTVSATPRSSSCVVIHDAGALGAPLGASKNSSFDAVAPVDAAPDNSSVAAPVAHEPYPPPDAAEEAPQSTRWAFTLCCGCKAGLRDLVISAIGGGNAVGLGRAVYEDDTTLEYVHGVATGLSLVAFFWWRKDATLASLHVVSNKIGAAVRLFVGNVTRAEEVEKKFGSTTAKFRDQRARLEEENKKLGERAKELEAVAEKMGNENTALKSNVQQLENDLKALQQIYDGLKQQNEEREKQNTKLEGQVNRLTKETEAFAAWDVKLKETVVWLDHTFDENVEQFSAQLQSARAANQGLIDEIEQMKAATNSVHQDREKISQEGTAWGKNVETLVVVEARLRADGESLAQIQAKFNETARGIANMKEPLLEIIKVMKSTAGPMSVTTEGLSVSTNGLAQMGSQLIALGEKIREQSQALQVSAKKACQQ